MIFRTASKSRPRCYNPSDPERSSWLAMYLGNYIRYSSARDMRLFTNKSAAIVCIAAGIVLNKTCWKNWGLNKFSLCLIRLLLIFIQPTGMTSHCLEQWNDQWGLCCGVSKAKIATEINGQNFDCTDKVAIFFYPMWINRLYSKYFVYNFFLVKFIISYYRTEQKNRVGIRIE